MKDSKKTNFTEDKNNKSNIKRIIIWAIVAIIAIITAIIILLLLNKKEYTITFESNGGSLVKEIIVNKNETIQKPEAPTKENHKFVGWYYNNKLYDFSIPVTSNIELEAKWEYIVSEVFSIKLDKQELSLFEGDTYKLIATIEPEDLSNKNITWKSSNPDIVSVDSNGNIKALKQGIVTITASMQDERYFAKTKVIVEKAVDNANTENENEQIDENTCTITFVNYNGKVLETKKVEYGQMPTYTKGTPTKPADAQYTYTFAGWNPSITIAEKNTTYTATYTEKINSYKVMFRDEDGSILAATQILNYGEKAKEPAIPSKEGHIFQDWYKGEEKYTFTEEVKGNVILTAKWIKNKYAITFVDEDNTILETKLVEYGQMPTYTNGEPTKPEQEKYIYKFAGWIPNITIANKDMTYKATYKEEIKKYEVTFKDEDGTTLSNAQTIEHGSKAVEPQPPTKAGHTFEGWYNGETKYTFTEEVKENINLVAKWTKNKYAITFVNYDGTELEKKLVEYGKIPTYTKSTPTKEANKTYTYLFAGWDKEVEAAVADTTYTATYTENYIEYLIIFLNEDGTELSKKTYHYGETVEQPQIPTKPSNEQYSYTFAGWDLPITVVEKDATYTATYTQSINIYEVKLLDEDGTELSSTQTVKYGNKATEPKDPEKKGHIFQGWYNGETKYTFTEEVKGNVNLIARWTKIKYTITFVNYDGTVLETKKVEYAEIPTYTKETPTKIRNEQYSYTFAGWEPSITAVEDDATYTATYTETLNSYKVTFVDEDGTELATAQTVQYGSKATAPTEPSKQGHTFAGWYNGIEKYTFTEEVKGNVKLTARWTKNKYTIIFANYDGTELERKTVEYGVTPTFTKETPTKAADNVYTYTFKGWDKEVVSATKNETYTATYTEKYIDYTIIFVNEDGTELSKNTYHYGAEVKEPVEPTKAGNAQYTFTFAGWNPSVTTVKGNATYTATYTETLNSYKVTFVDEDGTELATAQTVQYGSKATAPTEPSKQGHTFAGWYNGIEKYTFTEEVKGNVKLTARWTKNKYTIIFANYDGTELERKTVEYGVTPTFTKETPTKAADNVYTYTFKGWDKEVVSATKNETYTATYTEKYIDYTIIFVNEDGTELSKNTYHYGAEVKEPVEPTKAGNAQYTYTFAGWNPRVTTVKGNATYKATYTETLNSYKVTFTDEDGTTLSDTQTVQYGSKATEPTAPTKQGHTFAGWYNGETKYTFTEEVKGNVNLKARWTKNKYTIIFANYDGTELERKTVEYGATPSYTKATPTKPADAQYTYTFKGWDKDVVAVVDDATYTATYTETIRSYTVIFKNDDGTTLSTQTVNYGSKPAEPELPTKNGYTFQGWYNGETKYTFAEGIKGDMTLTARWEKATYTITFVNYDGKTLETKKVEHGVTPTYTKGTPTRPSDSNFDYAFTGWTPNITIAEKDMTYTATYKNFVDVDKKIEEALKGVNAKEFQATKEGNTITVKFVSYTENGTTVRPPYDLLDLASGVVNLLNGLSSHPSYQSVIADYKGNTIDLKNYEMDAALNWIGKLCGKSGMLLLFATTDDLSGKTVTIKIKLKDGYYLEDGKQEIVYNLKFL